MLALIREMFGAPEAQADPCVGENIHTRAVRTLGGF